MWKCVQRSWANFFHEGYHDRCSYKMWESILSGRSCSFNDGLGTQEISYGTRESACRQEGDTTRPRKKLNIIWGGGEGGKTADPTSGLPSPRRGHRWKLLNFSTGTCNHLTHVFIKYRKSLPREMTKQLQQVIG